MKKNAWIVTGCLLIAVTAVSALLWQMGTEVKNIPAALAQTAVCAYVEPPATAVAEIKPEPKTIAPAKTAPGTENGTINDTEPIGQEDQETSEPVLPQKAEPGKAPVSSESHMGDVRVVDGEKQVYILGFGWIKDEGGGNVGTVAEDMYENGNKIGVMGGGTTVGKPSDELTGNKVGIMGGGTTVHGKGDINKQVGIMGGEEPPKEPASPLSEEPEPTGEVINTELQPPVTKDSTPPPYKPNGEPTNP